MTPHIISRNGVYQINKQSLEMTAPAPGKPLLVCGTGMFLGSFAHPLGTDNFGDEDDEKQHCSYPEVIKNCNK